MLLYRASQPPLARARQQRWGATKEPVESGAGWGESEGRSPPASCRRPRDAESPPFLAPVTSGYGAGSGCYIIRGSPGRLSPDGCLPGLSWRLSSLTSPCHQHANTRRPKWWTRLGYPGQHGTAFTTLRSMSYHPEDPSLNLQSNVPPRPYEPHRRPAHNHARGHRISHRTDMTRPINIFISSQGS